MDSIFALDTPVSRPEFRHITEWIERDGLLFQGLGPGVALQLAGLEPGQATLCRHLPGPGTALMAEVDEEPEPLTLRLCAPAPASGRSSDGGSSGGACSDAANTDSHNSVAGPTALHAAIAAWSAAHPNLPLCVGPRLLTHPRGASAFAPQGLFIAYGTRRQGTLYQASSKGFDPTRPIRIRSLAKSLACAAVLRLQRRCGGAFSIDAPVAAYLPSWDRDGKRHLTLRHLLNHMSGIEPVPDSHPSITRADITLADAAAMLAELPVVAPVGARFHYWNAGYQVVGAVVEAVTGKTWNEAFRELVAEPLGLKSTTFLDAADSGPAPTNPSIGAAGISAPADVLRYAAVIANGGRVPRQQAQCEVVRRSAKWWYHQHEQQQQQQHVEQQQQDEEPFLHPDDFALLISNQAAGADPATCAISRRLMRPETGAHVYLSALERAGLISDDLAASARAQAASVGYAFGGWPSDSGGGGSGGGGSGAVRHNFTSLGYFGSVVHVAGADTDDPSWMVLLCTGRYTKLWQAAFAALEAAAGRQPL